MEFCTYLLSLTAFTLVQTGHVTWAQSNVWSAGVNVIVGTTAYRLHSVTSVSSSTAEWQQLQKSEHVEDGGATLGLRIETSSNIVSENLHTSRSLVTSYYVTDARQISDFAWPRDSGLRINVAVQNINIIPTYHDIAVAGGGDNQFMLSKPNAALAEIDRFTDILRRHCRYPIPDYYNVTLNVAPRRTTKAWTETCNVESRRSGRCPHGTPVGRQFIDRSVNVPCRNSYQYLADMKPAANSLICTQPTDLLSGLFGLTSASTVSPVDIPTDKCQYWRATCDQCLNNDACQLEDEFERNCCHIDCYSTYECRQAMAFECYSQPVECATGHVYRYTLTPVFNNLKDTFKCYLRRTMPDELYRLSFTVTAPFDIESPPYRATVLATTSYTTNDLAHISDGRSTFEFLTVEHKSGLPTPETDELILTGQEHQHTVGGAQYDSRSPPSGKVMQYSYCTPKFTQSMTTTYTSSPNSFRRDSSSAPSDILTELSTAVTFDRPFEYSSSTWTESDSCNKNITRFRVLSQDEQHFGSVPEVTSYSSTTPVEAVVVAGNGRTPFSYRLTSKTNSPHLKFTIPGNASVLRWWFRDKPSSVGYNASLKANLLLSEDNKNWTIHVTGLLAECPGFMEITINDRTDNEEMFRYDLLVLESPSFNVTFYFPNRQPSNKSSIKTFEIIVDDIINKHRIMLTSLPSISDVSATSAGGHTNVSFTVAAKFWMRSSTMNAGNFLAFFTTHSYIVAMVMTLSLVLLFVLNVAIINSLNVDVNVDELKETLKNSAVILPPESATSDVGIVRPVSNGYHRRNKTKNQSTRRCCSLCCLRKPSSSELRCGIIFFFLASKIICCFVLTFTCFTTVFVVLTDLRTDRLDKHQVEMISSIRHYLAAADRIFERTEAELDRFTSSMALDRYSSADLCERHSSGAFTSTWSNVVVRSSTALAAASRASTFDGLSTTMQLLNRYYDSVDWFGDHVMSRLNDDVSLSVSVADFYENEALLANVWLRFAANLFNATSQTSRWKNPSLITVDTSGRHSATRFINFLQAQHIHVHRSWLDLSSRLRLKTFGRKLFHQSASRMPFELKSTPTAAECRREGDDVVEILHNASLLPISGSSSTLYHQLLLADSVRYFGTDSTVDLSGNGWFKLSNYATLRNYRVTTADRVTKYDHNVSLRIDGLLNEISSWSVRSPVRSARATERKLSPTTSRSLENQQRKRTKTATSSKKNPAPDDEQEELYILPLLLTMLVADLLMISRRVTNIYTDVMRFREGIIAAQREIRTKNDQSNTCSRSDDVVRRTSTIATPTDVASKPIPVKVVSADISHESSTTSPIVTKSPMQRLVNGDFARPPSTQTMNGDELDVAEVSTPRKRSSVAGDVMSVNGCRAVNDGRAYKLVLGVNSKQMSEASYTKAVMTDRCTAVANGDAIRTTIDAETTEPNTHRRRRWRSVSKEGSMRLKMTEAVEVTRNAAPVMVLIGFVALLAHLTLDDLVPVAHLAITSLITGLPVSLLNNESLVDSNSPVQMLTWTIEQRLAYFGQESIEDELTLVTSNDLEVFVRHMEFETKQLQGILDYSRSVFAVSNSTTTMPDVASGDGVQTECTSFETGCNRSEAVDEAEHYVIPCHPSSKRASSGDEMTSPKSTAADTTQALNYVVGIQNEVDAFRSLVSTLLTLAIAVTLVASASTTAELAMWRLLIALRYVRLRCVSLTTVAPDNDYREFPSCIVPSSGSISGTVDVSETAPVGVTDMLTQATNHMDDFTRCTLMRSPTQHQVTLEDSTPLSGLDVGQSGSVPLVVRLVSSSSQIPPIKTLSVVALEGVRTFCESRV